MSTRDTMAQTIQNNFYTVPFCKKPFSVFLLYTANQTGVFFPAKKPSFRSTYDALFTVNNFIKNRQFFMIRNSPRTRKVSPQRERRSKPTA